ncbi:MAG: pyrroline-5-carboxylate reductase [Cardiobacteriaceae bacterium]|nr:pyrroline-5-carboxylate reductase [Cardiobacteriaceae bacterium]
MTDIFAFIGAGHLNRAIISGLISSTNKDNCEHSDCCCNNNSEQEDSFLSPEQILVSCKSEQTAKTIARDFSVKCFTDNRTVIEKASFLILGVRPNQVREVLEDIKQTDYQDKVIVSFAAGINIASYRRILGDNVIIVRAMPNLAANCQSSVTGIWTDCEVDEEQAEILDDFFASFGSAVWLDDETQIDGITALSGSGIAYFFRLMQAMAATGERFGFSPDELYDIISLTALGAATALLDNPDDGDFAQRVQKICTKGGTTEAAISHFDTANIDATVEAAMQAAVDRSRALSEEITKDW